MFKHLLLPLAVAGMIVSTQASAKVSLDRTFPADGATVPPLKEVSMRFTGTVTLLTLTVVHDRKKQRLDVGRVKSAMTLKVPVKATAEGSYTVEWSAITRVGGQFMSGAFRFTVANDAER